METTRSILLFVHVACGFAALAAALVAASVKALGMSHRVHVLSGRVFVGGMLGIVVTALPLALLGGSLLLFLVAILSGYLAFAGWREAVRRTGSGAGLDRAAALLMVLAGAAMLGWGALLLIGENSGGIVLVAFGSIGLSLSVSDLRRMRRPSDRVERIVNHMSRMMGATIAVLTAFLVVNVRFEPGWVVWLAPTAILTPLIFVGATRIRAGRLK